MRWREFAIPLLLLCAPGWLGAQYVGGDRPLGRAERLDSLTAVQDSLAAHRRLILQIQAGTAADSARIDSLVAAIASEIVRLDTRIDSLRDNPASSGGGGGCPIDTLQCNYLIVNRADSANYAGFSGLRVVSGTKADSAGGDTLMACITHLMAGGGKILVLADTVAKYDSPWDSLGAGGGIRKSVVVTSPDRNRHVLYYHQQSGLFPLFFTAGRPAGAGKAFLVFENLWCATQATGTSYQPIVWANGNVRWERCVLENSLLGVQYDYSAGSPAPTDSLVEIRDCEFCNFQPWLVGNTGASIVIEGCYGTAGQFTTRHYGGRLLVKDCDLWVNYLYAYADGSYQVPVTFQNCTFRQLGNHNPWVSFYTNYRIVGCRFVGTGNTTSSVVNFSTWGVVLGSEFNNCGVAMSGGDMTGCYLYYPATGVKAAGANVAVKNNVFSAATTAVNVNGQSGVVLHGNTFRSCSTTISGSPAVNTDNDTF